VSETIYFYGTRTNKVDSTVEHRFRKVTISLTSCDETALMELLNEKIPLAEIKIYESKSKEDVQTWDVLDFLT